MATQAKPVIRWKPLYAEDPSDRSKHIWVPTIVERNQSATLGDIVYNAIDRGYIAGLKVEAAAAIAEGIMTQLGAELNAAHGVIFGDYFAVRPYLSGTIEKFTSPLGADNKLNARFVVGSAFRLDRKDFSFRNVNDTPDTPVIDEIQANVSGGVNGVVKQGAGILLTGSNLGLGTTDTLVFEKKNGDDWASCFTADATDLSVNSNAALTLPGESNQFLNGDKGRAKVHKTLTDSDGRTAEVDSDWIYFEAVA